MATKRLLFIHPIEILFEEFLDPMELTQAEVARATGIPPSRLTEIIKGRRPVTAETALRLSRYFGTTAAFWVGFQAEHDLEVATHEIGRKVEREVNALAT